MRNCFFSACLFLYSSPGGVSFLLLVLYKAFEVSERRKNSCVFSRKTRTKSKSFFRQRRRHKITSKYLSRHTRITLLLLKDKEWNGGAHRAHTTTTTTLRSRRPPPLPTEEEEEEAKVEAGTRGFGRRKITTKSRKFSTCSTPSPLPSKKKRGKISMS